MSHRYWNEGNFPTQENWKGLTEKKKKNTTKHLSARKKDGNLGL